MVAIQEWLKLLKTEDFDDLDHPSATVRHAKIIQQKLFLRKIYTDFYNTFKNTLGPVAEEGVVVELGSGGGFLQEIIPHVRRSDILEIPTIDICFSGEDIPFKIASVDAFIMTNVFHHIKEPANLLKEIECCLKPGGQIIMIEPANTLWGRFIYQNFHHENFNPKGGWTIEGHGPMSDANGALPWIIFCRDRARFEKEFKNNTLCEVKYHTPFRYLISGGFSMRQLLPSFMYNYVKTFEIILTPLNRWMGMFMTIRLQKKVTSTKKMSVR
jgi:SAM-dependent methyltransferase